MLSKAGFDTCISNDVFMLFTKYCTHKGITVLEQKLYHNFLQADRYIYCILKKAYQILNRVAVTFSIVYM